jgi:hypothetical protein
MAIRPRPVGFLDQMLGDALDHIRMCGHARLSFEFNVLADML